MKKGTILTIILIAVMSFTFAQKTDVLLEGFEGASLPSGWTNVIETGNDNWIYQTGGANGGAYPATAHTGTFNACFRGFPNPSVTKLVTPALAIPNGATMNFWWASHTYFGAGDIDLLTVYYKDGFMGEWVELASYPDGSDDWSEATFSIPAGDDIYIAFEGSYDGGMGVCVDDVHVFTSDTDLGINNVQPILAFGTETTPTVKVHNYGLVEASSYEVAVTIAGTTYDETITDGVAIAAGEELIIEFPVWTLPAENTYEITATVTIAGDAVADNNTMLVNCIVDQTPIGNLLGYFDAGFGGQSYHCAYPETDGENIYVGKWSGNEFAISDFSGDDLAYDGEYFYTGEWSGSNGYSTIQQLDLANQTVVSTFTTTAYAENLAYNYNSGTFWGNAYSYFVEEFNPEGATTGELFNPERNVSGLAIDLYSNPENPTIWLYESGAANVVEQLVEYDFEGNTTGQIIPINATTFPGIVDNDDQAGGLACYVNAQNQVVLLVGVQNLHDTYDGRILYVYLGEAGVTYPVTLTVIDDQATPVEGATVEVGATKVSGNTDGNGQVIFDLIDNTYEFIVTKDCYSPSYGSFEVNSGIPTIDDIVLNSIDAPTLSNAIVLSNGLDIEVTFDNEMDLNGATAPAGFSIDADLPVKEDNPVTNVALKVGSPNVIVLTVENEIYLGMQVLLSYTSGDIQSECEIALEEIIDEEITNNSIVTSISAIKNNFKIYPNPATDYLSIENNTTIENVEIIDILGKTIYQVKNINSNNFELDVTNIEKGIYFIKINENTINQKLIIQ